MTEAKLNEGIALQRVITECEQIPPLLRAPGAPALPTEVTTDTLASILSNINILRQNAAGNAFATDVEDVISTAGVAFLNALDDALSELKTDSETAFAALEAE